MKKQRLIKILKDAGYWSTSEENDSCEIWKHPQDGGVYLFYRNFGWCIEPFFT